MEAHIGKLQRGAVVEEEDAFHNPHGFILLQIQQLPVAGIRRLGIYGEEGLGHRQVVGFLQIVKNGTLDNRLVQVLDNFDGDVAGFDHEGCFVKQAQPDNLVHKIMGLQEQIPLKLLCRRNYLKAQHPDFGLDAVHLKVVRYPQVGALIIENRLVLYVKRVDKGAGAPLLKYNAGMLHFGQRPLDGAAADLIGFAETALVRQPHIGELPGEDLFLQIVDNLLIDKLCHVNSFFRTL
ncbi:hypothetical protein D3C75_932880 [compost metagenome]